MTDTVLSDPAEDVSQQTPAGDDRTLIRHSAIRYLSRREHSTRELFDKLGQKGFDGELIGEVLADLAQKGLLSDERFAEAYVRYRCNRGFGPVRIRQELRERGIPDDQIDDYVDEADTRWIQAVRAAHEKRFGQELPAEFKDRAKQMRYLQYRGFSHRQINAVFRSDD